jgi:hypothetical protein
MRYCLWPLRPHPPPPAGPGAAQGYLFSCPAPPLHRPAVRLGSLRCRVVGPGAFRRGRKPGLRRHSGRQVAQHAKARWKVCVPDGALRHVRSRPNLASAAACLGLLGRNSGGRDPLMEGPPPTRPDKRSAAGPVVRTTGANTRRRRRSELENGPLPRKPPSTSYSIESGDANCLGRWRSGIPLDFGS